jgi:hypothetical protein
LERGQFWAIPLPDGSYGAGCVIGLHFPRGEFPNGKPSSRAFIAGVLEWHGKVAPTAELLRACTLVNYAFAHIKVITTTGGSILGKADLNLGDTPASAPSTSLSTWGFGVPTILANQFAGLRVGS